jgi:hypothetical protein
MNALDRVRLAVASGAGPGAHGPDEGLSARARRAVAAADAAGAPLQPVLDAVAAAEEDERRAVRAVTVATAQARTVVGGLVVAPVLLVPVIQRASGVDLVAFYRSPAGALVLALGLGLVGVGVAMVVSMIRGVGRPSSRRVRAVELVVAMLVGVAAGPVAGVVATAVVLTRVRTRTSTPEAGADEAAELVAAALSGGVGPASALRFAAAQLPAHRLALQRGALAVDLGHVSRDLQDPSPLERVVSLVGSAEDLGAPVVSELRRLGAELRAEDLARVLAATERLPAQLTFPTALLLMPGSLLLIGAPIVATGLAALGT